MLTVILLAICTCAYIRALTPSLLDKNKTGFLGIFWKFARIGKSCMHTQLVPDRFCFKSRLQISSTIIGVLCEQLKSPILVEAFEESSEWAPLSPLCDESKLAHNPQSTSLANLNQARNQLGIQEGAKPLLVTGLVSTQVKG